MHIGIVSAISTYSLAAYLPLKGKEPKGGDGATAPTLLVEELVKRGHIVSVFSLTRELEPGNIFTINGENLSIYFGAARKKVRQQIFDNYKEERKFLCNKILEIKPDILHAHWQYEHALGALDTKIPALVTCRDSPLHVLWYTPNAYRLLRLFVALQVIYKAKHLSATSIYLATNIRLLSLNKKVAVVPNFESDWVFSLYKQDRIFNPVPNIVMINNGFQKRKNVEVGIKAFQLIRKKISTSVMHLYGNGFEPNGYAQRWASSNGLDENIHFHGLVDFKILMSRLQEYNVLVHTAKEETFGNILAEAMAQGIPVVGGNKSGAVPEVIGENGKGGFLVDINSPEKVASVILKIVSSEKAYKQFSACARQLAIDKFKANNVVSAYEKIYLSIREIKDVNY